MERLSPNGTALLGIVGSRLVREAAPWHTDARAVDVAYRRSLAAAFVDPRYVLLFFYLALALGVSFLCSLMESALLSVPRSHVALLVRRGKRSGRLLDRMLRRIDRPLAAILTLNTFAHTFGAAGVGAQALAIFGKVWVSLTSIVVTLLILVVSEIIPKTLGAVHAKRLAPATAYIVQSLIWLALPLVKPLEALSRALGKSSGADMTREELEVAAEVSALSGILEERESSVIRNLLQLRRIKIMDVMTPRVVVFLLRRTKSVEEVLQDRGLIPFSRIPVYGETPDEITGVVLRIDILQCWHREERQTLLAALEKPIHAIPEVASVADALEQFIARRAQIFLAVDEYGGTAGIITLEDAIETLLGVEIVDETDSVDDMRKLARELAERRRRVHFPG